MRVPFGWLTEYCDPGLAPEEVAELLSMRAVEVERVSRMGVPSSEGFVVGRVLSAERHPNADRLSVCEVDTGEGATTIVCGAPNVAAGQTVAVAQPGARMPGGEKLEKAKLRGVESNGMILSERELEIGDDASGILVLSASSASRSGAGGSAEGPTPGTPLADVLPISEAVLELDLNPNRVDCMGIYGVAREVHAITGAPLAEPPWKRDAEPTGEGSVEDLASVAVEVPELCPRFTARAFSGVEIAASPVWLRARLLAAGMRPISNVVDITNYVMLSTAQPLHAFDLDRVPGGELIIRRALEGETMTTLDGIERRFDHETVLVCDRDGPSGIAGIMGGQVSEVSEQTTRVLLEVATWNGVNILRTSSMLGLRTDASSRYEKQLHPELALRAQRHASRLLAELAGAEVARGTIDAAAEVPPAHVISLHGARLDSLLGVEIEPGEAGESLERLGFEVEEVGGRELRATVPLHRHYDVSREVDLIEEVGRLHGFDRLPRTLPAHADRVGGLSREQLGRRRAEDLLRDLGFDEVVSWSIVDPGLADRPATGSRRPSPGGGRDPQPDLRRPGRDAHHAARRAARRRPPQPRASRRPGRPVRVGARVSLGAGAGGRGSARRSLRGPGCPAGVRATPDRGRARRRARSALVGWFAGCATTLRDSSRSRARSSCWPRAWPPSSRWRREWSRSPTAAARRRSSSPASASGGSASCIRWSRGPGICPAGRRSSSTWRRCVDASAVGGERYEDVTTFPAVLQDLAVTVAEDVPAERVIERVRAGGGALLDSVSVFDLYHGEQLEPGRRASRCGSSSGPPIERSPTPRSASFASGFGRSWPRSERRCVTERSQPLHGEPAARVLVAGASGYAGALAAELVWHHPRLELIAATARAEAGKRLDRLYPRYRATIELTELDLASADAVDAAIVAYPHGAAAPVVAALRGLGAQVVDLSADFRLVDAAIYELWYGPHGDPDLLENAVYGLTELGRERVREADLVANPGCYPTAALLALAPLAERGLLESVLIDAKSGVSGAGRGDGDRLHFVNVQENFAPYGVDGHRHLPEIEQELRRMQAAADTVFGPSSSGAPVSIRPPPAADRSGLAGELLPRSRR